jgi:hypothetical protein
VLSLKILLERTVRATVICAHAYCMQLLDKSLIAWGARIMLPQDGTVPQSFVDPFSQR